jgi:hypothetical protein
MTNEKHRKPNPMVENPLLPYHCFCGRSFPTLTEYNAHRRDDSQPAHITKDSPEIFK